jgi:hypothetical protein
MKVLGVADKKSGLKSNEVTCLVIAQNYDES